MSGPPDKRRSCDTKVRYEQKRHAENVAEFTPVKRLRVARAYFCIYCEGWHVGHDFAGRRNAPIEPLPRDRRFKR